MGDYAGVCLRLPNQLLGMMLLMAQRCPLLWRSALRQKGAHVRDYTFPSQLGTPHSHWLADLGVQEASPLASRWDLLRGRHHAPELPVGSGRSQTPDETTSLCSIFSFFILLPSLHSFSPESAPLTCSQIPVLLSVFREPHVRYPPIHGKHMWH